MPSGSHTATTKYDQAIVESAHSTDDVKGTSTRSGNDVTKVNGTNNGSQKSDTVSSSKQDTSTVRDLKTNSEVNKTSTEKVNVAFNIKFKVPIIGRFPTSTSCS